MSGALALFVVEVRRCLSRRLVWVLVTIALLGIALTSVLVFVNTAGASDGRAERELRVQECIGGRTTDIDRVTLCRRAVPEQGDERFKLTDVWPRGGEEGDRALAVTVVFLAIGALLGGASMVGAEWRAGSMATLLTWEPRRARLALARFAAVACCAFGIALALQVAFVVGLLPAVYAHGSTEGADGAWFNSLLGAFLRSESLAAMAAVFGASIAMIGRNTAAALGASFAYMLIGEQIVRGWKPWLRPWLLAENAVIFLLGYTPGELTLGRGFGAAAATLLLYTAALAAVAVLLFRARDVTAS